MVSSSVTWLSPFTYYLGGETDAPGFIEGSNAFSTYTWTASWTSSVANCPFEYLIEIQDSVTNSWRVLTTDEAQRMAMSP